MSTQEQLMVFEQQPYQEECIKDIMNSLKNDNVAYPLTVNHDNLINDKPVFRDENRIDISMETATGKTFVYLQTIFEMHKKFNLNKFIIIVPKTAILLGVRQTIEYTKQYFYNMYKKKLNYIVYPKEDGINKIVQNFINSNDLSIILLTNSAFNKNDNQLNKAHQSVRESSVLEGVINQKPVVIMDEPHLLAGRQTSKYLNDISRTALFMRFGATFQKNKDVLSNVVYMLDSVSAHRKKLVKTIQVSTIYTRSKISNVHAVSARPGKSYDITYMFNDLPCKKTVGLGQDLGAVTGITEYSGMHATKITAKTIYIGNAELPVGNYSLTDSEIREMVGQTIKVHFEHEEKRFEQGIKTLSLFFIPHIADFNETETNEQPRIKKIFEELYEKERKKVCRKTRNTDYLEYLKKDYATGKLYVHDGYFSTKGKNEEERVAGGVDLILNKKKELLSFDEPLRFVFSVWALQEGWDNPNVFNICKLSPSSMDTTRRQQVGRGLRIAVNQQGKRQTESYLAGHKRHFRDVNVLNMIVSAQESEFVNQLQEEIVNGSSSVVGSIITFEKLISIGLSRSDAHLLLFVLLKHGVIDEAGNRNTNVYDFMQANKAQFAMLEGNLDDILEKFQDVSDVVIDANKSRKMIKIASKRWNEFKELWEAISRRATITYKDVNEDEIIRDVSEAFNKTNIPLVQTTIVTHEQVDGIGNFVARGEAAGKRASYFKNNNLSQFIFSIAQERGKELPLRFMLKLFNKIDVKKIKRNPDFSKEVLSALLKNSITGAILEKVEYEFAETTVYANKLQDEHGNSIKQLPLSDLGRHISPENPPDNFLYDTLIWDSAIERYNIMNDPRELNIGNGKSKRITVFAKLPAIYIPLPDGTYSPDFAYVIEQDDSKCLFLVVETKGYSTEAPLKDEEKDKISYGKRFFESLQKQMPKHIEVRYRMRLENQRLVDIVMQECSK